MNPFLIVAGLVAVGLFSRGKGLLEFSDNLRFYIKDLNWQNLGIRSGKVEIPLKMMVENNSTTEVKIDGVLVTVYYQENGNWAELATTRPQDKTFVLRGMAQSEIDIPLGISVQTIAKILSSNLIAVLANLKDTISRLKTNAYKVEAKVLVGGNWLTNDQYFNEETNPQTQTQALNGYDLALV